MGPPMNIHLLRLVFLVSLLAAQQVLAGDEVPMPVLENETAEAFQPQVDFVRAQMQTGGRYEYIRDKDRERVNADLDTMRAMIVKHGTVAAMKEEDKIKLFNIQEKVNSILTNSDSNHMVCEKVPQPGSMMRLTTCHTYAELRRRTRDSQNELEKAQNNLMLHSYTVGAGGH
jgi:hypothetical protein